MTDRVTSLIHRFRQQQQFSASYSPLYTSLFGTCADWLVNDADDPLVKWLIRASEGRASFDVTNLLAAALHREVLVGSKEVSALAAFYPAAKGGSSSEGLFVRDESGTRQVAQSFVQALREAILERRDVLQSFIQTNSVQTNETGRGISWLLPVCLSGWDSIQLVDIGASAGLNLVAEQRAFRFVEKAGNRTLLDLGYGRRQQFVIETAGEAGTVLPGDCRIPKILSRTGCDLHPFQLQTAVDEQTLASFIWADQIDRLQRLTEGITAFHETSQSSVPVQLHALRLPEELPAFLEEQVIKSKDPLVVYSTYIKMYLPDKGAAMRTHISRWAEIQQRPVLWIQWEPPKCVALETGHEPEYGWLAWTLDHWHDGKHEQMQIGWVHPHGQQLQWMPGFQQWITYWRDAGRAGDSQVIGQ